MHRGLAGCDEALTLCSRKYQVWRLRRVCLHSFLKRSAHAGCHNSTTAETNYSFRLLNVSRALRVTAQLFSYLLPKRHLASSGSAQLSSLTPQQPPPKLIRAFGLEAIQPDRPQLQRRRAASAPVGLSGRLPSARG